MVTLQDVKSVIGMRCARHLMSPELELMPAKYEVADAVRFHAYGDSCNHFTKHAIEACEDFAIDADPEEELTFIDLTICIETVRKLIEPHYTFLGNTFVICGVKKGIIRAYKDGYFAGGTMALKLANEACRELYETEEQT